MPSRNEQYLEAAVNKSGTDGLPKPVSRNEKLLHRLVEEMSELPSTNGAPYQQLVTDGDGNTNWEDRLAYDDSKVVVGDIQGVQRVKVADEIPSWVSVDAPMKVWQSSGDNLTLEPEDYIDIGNGSFVAAGFAFFITTDNTEIYGFVFPKKGVYITKFPDYYVTGIASADSDTPEITWDGDIGELKKIDPKYIPSELNEIILPSSTSGSSKQFRITVDDTGELFTTDGNGNVVSISSLIDSKLGVIENGSY